MHRNQTKVEDLVYSAHQLKLEWRHSKPGLSWLCETCQTASGCKVQHRGSVRHTCVWQTPLLVTQPSWSLPGLPHLPLDMEWNKLFIVWDLISWKTAFVWHTSSYHQSCCNEIYHICTYHKSCCIEVYHTSA